MIRIRFVAQHIK